MLMLKHCKRDKDTEIFEKLSLYYSSEKKREM